MAASSFVAWLNVDTVDGSEIRRSPVEVGGLSHYLQGFSTIPGGAGFLPSTVCQFPSAKIS